MADIDRNDSIVGTTDQIVNSQMELDSYRKVLFRDRKELLIIEENQVSVDKLEDANLLFSYIPDTIYVESKGKLAGILTGSDIGRSLQKNTACINRQYLSIDTWEQTTKESVRNFFNSHLQILNVPMVIDGKLIGDFRLSYGGNLYFSSMHWRLLRTGIRAYIVDNKITSITIKSKTSNTSNAELEEILAEMLSSNRAGKSLCLYDRTFFGEFGKTGGENETLIYQFYIECQIKQICKRCQENNVSLFYIAEPDVTRLTNLNEELVDVLNKSVLLESFENDDVVLKRICDGYPDSYRFMKEKTNFHFNYIDTGKYYQLADYASDTLNVFGGVRVTTDQPDTVKHRIHTFGNCFARGECVCDHDTIESALQRKLNSETGDWAVENYGLAGFTGIENDFQRLLHTELASQDIVCLFGNYSEKDVDELKAGGGADATT